MPNNCSIVSKCDELPLEIVQAVASGSAMAWACFVCDTSVAHRAASRQTRLPFDGGDMCSYVSHAPP